MNPAELVSAAKHRYRKGGAVSLLKHTTTFAAGSAVLRLSGTDSERTFLDVSTFESHLEQTPYFELADDVEALSIETCNEAIPLQDNESLSFQHSPIFEFRQPFVAEIEGALIIGPHATVFTNNGTVLSDVITDRRERVRWMLNAAITKSPYRVWTALRGNPQEVTTPVVPTAAILYYQSDNYYHWLLEQLLKLRQIEHYESRTETSVTLLVRADAPPFVDEFLELCGRDQYIRWGGEPLLVDRFVAPSRAEPTPAALEWLRTRFDGQLEANKEWPKWVYVSRQRAPRGRQVSNFDELKPVLDRYGVEIVQFESLSLVEEIALCRQAEGIIGPHGAGLTSQVWSDQLTVIELFNNVVKAPFYILSHVLGHNYTALAGYPTETTRRPVDRNFAVDVDEIEAILQEKVSMSV